jgi:DNA-binding IscR family transcriptional regulator
MNSDFVLAVHAMVFLHHKTETVSSDVLAENICTNPARVRRVMTKLKKAGLVETREGRTGGGYSYQKTKQVTLGDISKALNVKFANSPWKSGDIQKPCVIASGMPYYMEQLYSELNARCEGYLNTVTIAEVEQTLMARKKNQES